MERLIVFALVFLLPAQLAYHFWPQSSYIHGLRVDYLSPAVYLTDILIVLILPYLIRRIDFKKIKKIFLLPTLITFFVLLNIFFAQVPGIALLKWIAVLKMVILGLYFYSCDLKMLKKTIPLALSFSLMTIFLIGLTQFIIQKTVGGLLYYLGERSFTSLTPGISLMNVFGKSLMRAYSTFSHPNSFAGFVVVSFLVLLSFNLKSTKGLFIVVVLSMLLTLSLNAIVGTCLVVILFFVLKFSPKIVKKTKVFFPVVAIGLSFLFGIVSGVSPKEIPLSKTYRERVVLAGNAIEAFSKRPALGIGLNNFFFATKSVQPPHNIYLIILAETGIAGTLILFYLLSKLLDRKLNKYLFLAVFFVLVTGLFDHYWLTLQQNQLLLSFLVGLAARRV